LINQFIKVTSLKKNYLTEKNTKKLIKKISNQKYDVPDKLGLMLELEEKMKVFSYNGTMSKPKDKIILYFHGGSYIEEAMIFQVKFAMKIAKKSNATLIFPLYPLAPKYNYKDAYREIDNLYDILLKTEKKIIFLGDSAGGGLSLSYSMYLRDKNKKIPKKVLLLSPWLDLTLTNPAIKKVEKYDPICAIEGNVYAGKLWAGEINPKNYLVSPLYGEFNNLPEITIASGEYDIMQPDCLQLSNILAKEKIEHNYIEYKEQGHDFGVFPIREGRLLIDDFVTIIKEYNKNGK